MLVSTLEPVYAASGRTWKKRALTAMSPTLEVLRDELKKRNEGITVQVRTLAVGLLAFTAAILGGVLGFGARDYRLPRWAAMNLLLVAVLLFIVLLIDLCQIVLSLEFIKGTIDEAECQVEAGKILPDADFPYDYTKPKYRWAWIFFRLKIGLLALSTLWFGVVTIIYCVRFIK